MINDETTLRINAKAFLPRELDFLAKAYGFKYTQVKIRKSKTRWGSCSSKGVINLSFYLMLLPSHLIRYVLLHELCHTVQMNHGPAFWALLDKCTDGFMTRIQAMYASIPYIADGRKIVKVGAEFDSSKRRLSRWMIA